MKKKRSLKWQMMQLIFFSWLIPILCLILIMVFVVGRHMRAQEQKTITTSMEKAANICTIRLQDCVEASKDASYLPYLREIYAEYQMKGEEMELRSQVNRFLQQQYKYNDSFRTTFLYFADDPDEIYYMGSRTEGSGYSNYVVFQSNGLQKVRSVAEELDTKTAFVKAGGRVYMVRNVMSRSFTPYAVLIMELDTEHLFDVFNSVWAYSGHEIRCDGELLLTSNFPELNWTDDTLHSRDRNVHFYENGTASVTYAAVSGFDQKITFAVSYDRRAANVGSRSQMAAFAVLMFMMIPLMLVMRHFLNKRVVEPVGSLAEASRAVADGNYGIRAEDIAEGGEVAELTRDFNRMSEKLKLQFEKIYVEEIALRDANIHALQSQINPHFLNNTLEIINWEARMGGNENVSLMIEALSTMLNATLDRKRRPMIPLSEEMEYVQAYLFIIGNRFGERFTYTSEIDETLLREEVPRLIIQPVIENAVEHGTEEDGRCRVTLRIGRLRDGSGMYISVINGGELKDEDRARIDALLAADDGEAESLHASEIGIRNVNRRLKILFGEESGLLFKTDNDGNTVCTILIKNPQL